MTDLAFKATVGVLILLAGVLGGWMTEARSNHPETRMDNAEAIGLRRICLYLAQVRQK
jgi:hypothetical protein